MNGGAVTDVFITINQWMVGGGVAAFVGSFLWGVVSVLFSPCHLASIPLIVGYVGGQNELLEGRRAAFYSVTFTLGLFITIAAVGIITAALGRMLGDLGPWWTIPVGAILIWVSMDFLGILHCTLTGNLLGRLQLRGMLGAFVLGLAYGVLSGSCTFGFIAPILAVITIQQEATTGITLILLFGLGHCLPIVVAGSSTAWVKKALAQGAFHRASRGFRIIAGGIIGILGGYFILLPFVGR